MKREIYLPVLGIVVGELLIFIGHINVGLLLYIFNLQVISFVLIFRNIQIEIKKVLQSMILLMLLRIISFIMPHFFGVTFFWLVLINGIMFIPIYLIIKNQHISLSELGVNFKRPNIYLLLAPFIGIIIAALEYRILEPEGMMENLQYLNIVLIFIVMFVFVGPVEELIFRSILLTRLEKTIGIKNGLFLSAILFGIMHSSFGRFSEILIAVFFGLIIGYIFQKTRNFPVILIINGTANMFLFGIFPILLK